MKHKVKRNSKYATPDRDKNEPAQDEDLQKKQEVLAEDETKPNTVTPLESGLRDAGGSPVVEVQSAGKHVRFGQQKDEAEHVKDDEASPEGSPSSRSKRGLVSRRGGRLGSPAAPRSATVAKDAAPVLEFKTYRSPQRKRDAVENDTIPSLCSANSGGHSVSSDKQAAPGGGASKVADKDAAEEHEGDSAAAPSAAADEDGDSRRPLSISCDKSMVDTTSPLASHDVDASPSAAASRSKGEPGQASTPSKPTKPSNELDSSQGGRRNVTFSPPPPPSDVIRMDAPKKTPTKSPTGGQFQSLPSLHDAKLSSPCGIFLSPTPPSPSAYASVTTMGSFEKKDKGAEKGDQENKEDSKAAFQEEKSAKARDQERERAVATPTDFAFDFGKGLRQTASFDASNVLAWLQSPTANGLFSPGGGLGSDLNTPRGGLAAPRTPHTPTMSTSFFFSDVASLPRNEFASPRGESNAAKRGGPQGVYSSTICISPLASSKRRGPSQPHTPMNYNDVFASPRDPRESGKPTSLPYLGDSPTKGMKSRSSKDGNLDAHMAERDLMEDEDLSVLLQLASNTPASTREGGSSGSHVFRSPRGQKIPGFPHRPGGYGENPTGPGLPALQLPVIGGRGDGSSKLTRKPNSSREHGGQRTDEFRGPQLAIRSSSSGGSKEIYMGGQREGAKAPEKNESAKSKASEKSKSSGAQSSKSGGATKKGSSSNRKGMSTTYSIPGAHPPYPHHPGSEAPVPYYPLPGTMPAMPAGGSMRVVVGGPPPGRPNASGSGSSPARHPGSPSRQPPYALHPGPNDGSYPRHPASMPYPPHGVYSQHPHMHYPGMYPPPHHHHPGHMPMYSSQHPQGGPKSTMNAKKGKASKAGATKRPASSIPQGKAPGSASKKAKKSPSKGSGKKKTKTVSITSNDPVDRQKAAAAIQAVNAASGGHNDRAAALAAAILRGVTMRPSGKWQAQLYYAGKSRYIGVFDTREKAALAYEIAREKLKNESKIPSDQSAQSLKATEAAVNSARKAAFEGVNEKDPRLSSK